MAYDIEFFRRTRAEPSGQVVRRHTGDFANLEEATAYGLSHAGDTDGFRIYVNGVSRKTVSIHPAKRDT
jgi:hypothetical protein